MADNNRPTVYMGGDQKGHELREEILKFLRSKGWNCVELGTFRGDDTSYERIQHEVEEKVNFEEPGTLGLLVFGTQEQEKKDEKEGS